MAFREPQRAGGRKTERVSRDGVGGVIRTVGLTQQPRIIEKREKNIEKKLRNMHPAAGGLQATLRTRDANMKKAKD